MAFSRNFSSLLFSIKERKERLYELVDEFHNRLKGSKEAYRDMFYDDLNQMKEELHTEKNDLNDRASKAAGASLTQRHKAHLKGMKDDEAKQENGPSGPCAG